jgi:hypothetical protein
MHEKNNYSYFYSILFYLLNLNNLKIYLFIYLSTFFLGGFLGGFQGG